MVVGGKLQGVEATYLAHKAGWDVILVDKDPYAPAIGLCDEYHQLDLGIEDPKLSEIFQKADLIVPAIEDQVILNCIQKLADREGYPLAFDSSAYAISSSKRKSDELFTQHGIPIPAYWPHCGLPVMLKPSDLSGSLGVNKMHDPEQLKSFLKRLETDSGDWIVQEYLEGPSYSLEVLGFNGIPLTLQVTDLEMDEGYDCKRVIAPTILDSAQEKRFREISSKIAGLINLNGIMDVEIIDHNGSLKVLEIDARLPSQTPTVVYKSTGINMLTALNDVYVRHRMPVLTDWSGQKPRAVIYEHILVKEDQVETLGEHIMAGVGHLSYIEGFFGADEALTNYQPGVSSWVATLIITNATRKEAWEKRCDVIGNIIKHCHLSLYVDSVPND